MVRFFGPVDSTYVLDGCNPAVAVFKASSESGAVEPVYPRQADRERREFEELWEYTPQGGGGGQGRLGGPLGGLLLSINNN